MGIAVCVATYQRPEGLKRLMAGLNQLTFSKGEPPKVEVIVVDNDATGSARELCESFKSDFKWPLQYCIEPQRGISYARNRAIASVSKEAEFVAFIDDDEVPDPAWLEMLLLVQKQYDADVVSGPVIPHFIEENVPDWVIKGRFFEVPRYPTGHLLKVAYTNNVLIRSQVLREMDKLFDERFAITGGEDSHFFMRVYRAGYKLVWADEALVYEWIPESRTNVRWILQRGYRMYSTHGLCERELDPLIQVLPKRMTTGMGRMALGFGLLLPSLLWKRHLFIKALLQIARGAGMLSGLAGRHYEEYKSIHGT
ncbi:MAG TPA: glycosyl transferase family 2 [Cyanobacteria bacterium UBA8803]|nr:glycosyl transferase family 2 [Cyanobacteria bacterium UBA9273]HBL58802.1 glycosyl transferase family 2 [Cyanobacteria bacterium UBA8803]